MKIGVFFCQLEDDKDLNYEAIAKYSANLPDVELVQAFKPHQRPDVNFICDRIREHNLGRIVIAGDMPGYFKPVFTKAMYMAGSNTNEVRLASFQEHGARGKNAIDRAKAVVACATMGVPSRLQRYPAVIRSTVPH